MSQSLVQIYVHVVFSSKDRKQYLIDSAVRERLHLYLVGACRNMESPSLQVGGVADHVHLLIRLGKTVDIATLVRELKRESSNWVKSEFPQVGNFSWQCGYGAFSISPSHANDVVSYIQNQAEHHKQVSFQDEFRRICQKYCVPLDERYAWD
jgi:putative transposase